MAKKIKHFRIAEDLDQKLVALSEITNLSMTDIVEEALRETIPQIIEREIEKSSERNSRLRNLLN